MTALPPRSASLTVHRNIRRCAERKGPRYLIAIGACTALLGLPMLSGCQSTEDTGAASPPVTGSKGAAAASPGTGASADTSSPGGGSGTFASGPAAGQSPAPAGNSPSTPGVKNTSVGTQSAPPPAAIVADYPQTSTGAQDVMAGDSGSTDNGLAQATGKFDNSGGGGNKMPRPDKNGQYTAGPPGDPLTPSKGNR